jgi:RNA polymerase primary sigma factor
VQKLVPHEDLDRILSAAVDDPTTFEAVADATIRRFDAEDVDLEIADPMTWRRGAPVTRTSFALQFRADVDSIVPMEREEEARLARRIEFARRRHERAAAEIGLPLPEKGTDAHRRLMRRAAELHALRSEMVERNLYLVLINVQRYSHGGANRIDLIQEGCLALFRAVDGFDWRRGLLFRTYAVHWLNQAFRNFLYNHSHTVRVPVYLQKALRRVNQASVQLGDPRPKPQALAEVSGLEEGLVSSALSASRTSYSLDAEGRDGEDGARLRDLLVDPSASGPYRKEIEDVSLEAGLSRAMADLSDRDQLVLRLRFGLEGDHESTLAEVAERLGVSVERVRQIQMRALSKLDTPALRRDLEPFLN